MKMLISMIVLAVTTVISAGAVHAQVVPESKVPIAFNRYYDYPETVQFLQRIAAAYPELVKLQTIGKSLQGREMLVAIVTSPKNGPHQRKAAMWIDGNIHGNEVQATEVVLYTLWQLTRSYGANAAITQLLDERTLYLAPLMSPDGRQYWFENANTPHSSRHNQRPIDKDLDGKAAEDGPDDLDGDGHITQMWKEDPAGRWVRSQTDERVFTRLRDDQNPATGVRTYLSLGDEGIDNDLDGRVNEDSVFGDDMNRNWPSDWQPTHIQSGAGPFPLSSPETLAVAAFVRQHPNIAAAQSYHNTGGMILRGPGAAYRESEYPAEDVRVYEEMQRVGEQMLPYYRAMVIHRDLYRVHGGEVTWFSEGVGAYAFTNELWTVGKYFQRDGRAPDEDAQWLWRDRMAFGDLVQPYKEVDHPQYGRVLVGGPNKWSSRVTPLFMLEEECHRNFAFTMYHADQMPRVEFGRIDIQPRPGGHWQITAEIRNSRLIPTRSAVQQRKRIGAADLVSIQVSEGSVLAAAKLDGWYDLYGRDAGKEPARVLLPEGVPSRGARVLRWIVRALPEARVSISYTAERALPVSKSVELRATKDDSAKP